MGKITYLWIVGVVILVVIAFFAFSRTRASSFEAVKNFNGEMNIYKSSNCGCCGLYGSYFKRKGNSNVKITDIEDIDTIKEQYNVPSGLRSCHTTIIGDYFVEGHIPLEAIDKLIEEKPDIAGIAMPGMPSGSPGMPGSKIGDFVIYAVEKDGSYGEFMRI